MAWKELHVMKLREQFVLRSQEPGVSLAAVCREFEISRKTGYKWLQRHAQEGLDGLRDRSRRPRSSPLEMTAEVAADAMAIRQNHPSWGARKIAAVLANRDGPAPSERTVARLLDRAGLVQARRVRRRLAPVSLQAPQTVVEGPNDLWTIDFKGWWLSPSGQRCEPLTIRDAYSRYVLSIRLLSSTKTEGTRRVMEDVFSRYGLPKAILSDNGSPFACRHGQLGLTTLSTWWLTLGIALHRSRPATPADNGGHERMHRDMQQDLCGQHSLARRQGHQEAWDSWGHDFNHLRPHEALAMKTPAQVYRPSKRLFTPKPVMLVYPGGFDVRLVDKIGKIRIKQQKVFLSHALRHQNVGLLASDTDLYEVWIAATRLGTVDLRGSRGLFTAP